MDSFTVAFTLAIATVVLLLYAAYNLLQNSSKKDSSTSDQQLRADSEEKNAAAAAAAKQQASAKSAKEKKQYVTKSVKDAPFRHPLLSTTLKAHSDSVTGIDFSSNGKYLLSCGNDRAVFMWSTKEFELPQHKNIRCNVEFDHAVKVRFSPDSKSFIAGLGISNTIRAFKIVKKDDTNMHMMQAAVADFPQMHKADLINVGLACNAKFIMSCSKDTHVVVWSTKGDILGTVDTRLMNNSFASVSPCGRFFGVCGFTPDVKVWEVCFDKVGNFREIKRAFELKGHSAGVYNFSFNSDSTRMASVSKDSTWILWDTNIEYERGQEAKILTTGRLATSGPSLIALSPDAYSLAVSVGQMLYFFDTLSANCDETVEKMCTDCVHELCFTNDNKFLAVACDRHVKVFYNLTGHRAACQDLELKLKSAKTAASKERIEQSIQEHKQAIEAISHKSPNNANQE